jgi:hypothetical protein
MACDTPRNIYLDLGVNWCNTLQLYRDIPEARTSSAPWEVWGFEAAPLIMPFAEKCAHSLSSGLPIPTPPIPPAGSTKDLWRYAKSCDCERYKKAPKRDLGAMRNCMVGRLRGALDALRPDPTLTSNASLVAARLALAQQCPPAGQTSRTTLVPAAASAAAGELSLSASPENVLYGGGGRGRGARVKVQSVDAVGWMRRSFAERDLLILKMDIEGAERGLLPRLVDTGAIKLVDVLLWECHLDSSWCRKWTTKAKAANPSLKVYVEPYPWAKRVPDFVANRGAWCQT